MTVEFRSSFLFKVKQVIILPYKFKISMLDFYIARAATLQQKLK
jgi:hypothetical protein